MTRSVNFPTRISPNGKSPFLDLVMTNFPANVSSSSSAPIGSSDHMLVKVNITLAILRELPQHWRVCGVCSPSVLSLSSNGSTADSAREKAECLNSVFASKSCAPNPSLSVSILPCHTPLLLDCVFCTENVERVLSTLNSESPTGPDGISSQVLKTCSAALAHPLSVLFTLSFVLGHLPFEWKSANITALHKEGATTDLNCRPISYFQSSARSYNP